MARGLYVLAVCAMVGLFPSLSAASENVDSVIVKYGTMRTNTADIDDYNIASKNATIIFKSDLQGSDETATVELECVGEAYGRDGNLTTAEDDFMGGWAIKAISGSCYGRDFDKTLTHHLDYTARSECDESSELSPDEKDYCVWEGLNDITGDTGDDMFQIKANGSGFLEYRKPSPEIYNEYRVRWLSRNSGTNSTRTLMIPSGPTSDFKDYTGFMDRYAGSTTGAVRVEKACLPIEFDLCSAHPPITVDDYYVIKEETTLSGNILSNDYDPDDGNPDPDPIAVSSIISDAKHGTFSWDKDGVISYTPDNNWYGTEVLTYEIADSLDIKTQGTITIVVQNLPEIQAKNDSITMDEDTSKTFNVLDNDSNPNNYTVTVDSLTKNVSNGTLSWNSDGKIIYRPRANWYGTETFAYTSYDQKGTYSSATGTITVVDVPELSTAGDVYGIIELNASRNDSGDVEAGKAKSDIGGSGGKLSGGASVYQDTGSDNGGFIYKLPVLGNDSGQNITITKLSNVSGLPNNHKVWIGPGSTFVLYQAGQDGNTRNEVVSFNYTATAGGDTDSARVIVNLQDRNSPLILDLDGDGIEVLNGDETTANFDLDLDGEAEAVGGWIGSDDAFLVLDSNNDGIINDKSELFGDTDGFSDGFANLASYDSDGNGLIDMGDDIYGSLQLWQDINGDGLTDANELTSLFDSAVASIDLNATYVDQMLNEQWESHTSSFTFDDGTVGQISDIWFADQ